jgi:hypothetical protein
MGSLSKDVLDGKRALTAKEYAQMAARGIGLKVTLPKGVSFKKDKDGNSVVTSSAGGGVFYPAIHTAANGTSYILS